MVKGLIGKHPIYRVDFGSGGVHKMVYHLGLRTNENMKFDSLCDTVVATGLVLM